MAHLARVVLFEARPQVVSNSRVVIVGVTEALKDADVSHWRFHLNYDVPARWLAKPQLAEAIARLRPIGLRRGSLLSLRERRLVGDDGLEPPTSSV